MDFNCNLCARNERRVGKKRRGGGGQFEGKLIKIINPGEWCSRRRLFERRLVTAPIILINYISLIIGSIAAASLCCNPLSEVKQFH